MGLFTDYVNQTSKKYEFRVRIAVEPTAQQLTYLKMVLERYDVESIGELKHLPIKTWDYFSHLGVTDLWMFDVVTKYPATPVQIQLLISTGLKLPLGLIMVVTVASDEIAAPISDKKEDPKKAPILSDLVSDIKNKINIEYPFAIKPKLGAQTTNDLPQGNVSPLTKTKRPVDLRKDNE
jgi:hypothetical protein